MKITKSSNELPITYNILLDNIVIGTCILSHNNYLAPITLSPLITDLYIQEDYRWNNLGKYLLDFVVSDAYNYWFHTLYLTTNLDSYYEKIGWSRIDDGIHMFLNKTIKVYKQDYICSL